MFRPLLQLIHIFNITLLFVLLNVCYNKKKLLDIFFCSKPHKHTYTLRLVFFNITYNIKDSAVKNKF